MFKSGSILQKREKTFNESFITSTEFKGGLLRKPEPPRGLKHNSTFESVLMTWPEDRAKRFIKFPESRIEP